MFYRSMPGDTDASMTGQDFFEDNAPMRMKQPLQKPGTFYSDTEVFFNLYLVWLFLCQWYSVSPKGFTLDSSKL